MLSILIALLILALVVYVAIWIIDMIGLPQPANKIAKVIVGVIALIVLLQMLLPLAGHRALL